MSDTATPLISVIIPTYNHGRYLGRALKSLLDQTHANWEAFVVDNHSTDNTDEVIANFFDPRIIHLKIHNNGVIAASRNVGIRAAKGVWLAFLDSDDWWFPIKLAESLGVAERENADLIYHDLYLARKLKQKVYFNRVRSWQLNHPIYDDLLRRGNALQNSSVMVKRAILNKTGEISEASDKISWEDFDYWLRISKVTERFFYIPKALGNYWVGGGNVTNPKRTRLNFEAILRHHVNERFDKPPFWISYRYGKTLFSCGAYEQSVKTLSEVDFNDTSWFNAAKCRVAYWGARITWIYSSRKALK